jgi:hypothetical protein
MLEIPIPPPDRPLEPHKTAAIAGSLHIFGKATMNSPAAMVSATMPIASLGGSLRRDVLFFCRGRRDEFHREKCNHYKLVKKGILPTADLNTAMPPTVTHQLANKIRLFTPWSLPGPVSGKRLGSARLAQDEEPGLLSVRNRGRNGCPKNASFYFARV